MTIISTTVGRNPLEIMENDLSNNRMISVHFQDKLFNVTIICQASQEISNKRLGVFLKAKK